MYNGIWVLVLFIFVCMFGIACLDQNIIFEKKVEETKASTNMITVTIKGEMNRTAIINEFPEKMQTSKNCGSVEIMYDPTLDQYQIAGCNLILEGVETEHCNLLDDLKMITYEQIMADAKATYNPITKHIRVETDNCDESVFYHELGHHVWYTKLSKHEKQEWCELWNETRSFITNYASTNCKEDFAENFAYFIVGSSDIDRGKENLLATYTKK